MEKIFLDTSKWTSQGNPFWHLWKWKQIGAIHRDRV